MTRTVFETHRCEGGCGTVLRQDGRFCLSCERYQAELEAKRLLGHRGRRLAEESARAAGAGDPERRSALLARLPRAQAGLTEVCEASDFPSIVDGLSWSERLRLLALLGASCGLAGMGVFLFGLGVKTALGWLLARV